MKIRIVHLLSNPTDEREIRSIASVSPLKEFGCEYIQIANAPYDGRMPVPRDTDDRGFELTPRHYGCYVAHRGALSDYLADDCDALLICECDCIFVESWAETMARMRRAYEACTEGDLLAFTFGFKHDAKTLEMIGADVILISQWIESHCYMVLPRSRDTFSRMFAQPWDTYDFCLTVYLLDQWKQRVGTFADRPIAVQAAGMSLLDHKLKTSEDHYVQLRY